MLQEIGSPAWATRTQGRLGQGERRAVRRAALRELARSAPGLLGAWLGRQGPARAPLDVLDVPDTPLARRTEEVARRHQSPAMLGHALRSVAFAHALGGVDGIAVDDELLWCACLLHDVALEDPEPGACFAVRGGAIARAVAREAGASTAVADTLADAVCRHATPALDPARDPLPYLVAGGALVDVLGKRLHELDRAFVGEVLRAHPRGRFAHVIADAWRAQARAAPYSRAGVVQRSVCFATASRWAPLRDPRPQATV